MGYRVLRRGTRVATMLVTMVNKTIAICATLALVGCIDNSPDDDSDLDHVDNTAQSVSGTQGDIVATGAGQFALSWVNLDTPAIRAAVDDANARGALLGN